MTAIRAIAVLIAIVSAGLAAPAPRPVQKKPPTVSRAKLIGGWRMEWGSGCGEIVLDKSGAWWCAWRSSVHTPEGLAEQWVGTWRLEGNRLHVEEHRTPTGLDALPGPAIHWYVDLDPRKPTTGKAWMLHMDGLGRVLPPSRIEVFRLRR